MPAANKAPKHKNRQMSQEARERIAAAAREMHAKRRQMAVVTGRAAELRAVADVLELAQRLSPTAQRLLKEQLG